MCGIVGVMCFEKSAIIANHMNIFMNLLWSDAARGMHGTGAFAVADDGSNYRVRMGGPPHLLIDSTEFDKFDKFVSKKWTRAVVGHNRFATRGTISTEHSHPFRSADGNIILVHNGTLDTFKHLPGAKKLDVDSEAICEAIAQQGVEKTIKSLKGAWVLVWYDGNNKTINFLRNKERPLWFAKHRKEQFIAFCSELGLLQWACNRNGMYDLDFAELPVDQHFSFSLDSSKPLVKELKGAADQKSDDRYWEGWTARGDVVGPKGEKVQEDTKVIYLPRKNSSNGSSSTSTSTPATNIPANRGVPFRSKSNSSPAASEKAYWIRSSSIHDLADEMTVDVVPIDYRAIETDRGQAEGLYQVRCLCDDYPDIEFFVNMKGIQSVQAVLDAPKGMRGTIRSILRSMVAVSKFPHQIHLADPIPMYTDEPEVPEHAYVA